MEKLLGAYSMKIPEFLEEEYNGALADIEKVIARAYVFEEFVKTLKNRFNNLDKERHMNVVVPHCLLPYITDVMKEFDRRYPDSERTWTVYGNALTFFHLSPP